MFDRNAPIVTPAYTNTIDASAPSSRVVSAGLTRRKCRDLRVRWAGADAGAGVASFAVYAARNGGPFKLWRLASRRSLAYRVAGSGTYSFYSRAIDGVGHVESARRSAPIRVALKCRGKRCSATTTTADWNRLVSSVTRKGNRLVIRLSRARAARLHIRALRLRVNGRSRITTRGVPAQIILKRAPTGPSSLALISQGGPRPVRAQRTTSTCSPAPVKRHK